MHRLVRGRHSAVQKALPLVENMRLASHGGHHTKCITATVLLFSLFGKSPLCEQNVCNHDLAHIDRFLSLLLHSRCRCQLHITASSPNSPNSISPVLVLKQNTSMVIAKETRKLNSVSRLIPFPLDWILSSKSALASSDARGWGYILMEKV